MKNDRQLKILEIIAEEEIRTQEELILALRRFGFAATQATVSRDIKELHLQKITAQGGGTKYAVEPSPKQKEKETLDKYRNVLHQVLTSAVPAGNIGVLKTLSGTANAAAAALEAMDFNEIIGTLAGDDTLLVLFAGERGAFDFCQKINNLYLKD
ncbi:MAG: arginine repressor [Clostridia bacterium]|nr:arginine repressor [Clostridia bacterium]